MGEDTSPKRPRAWEVIATFPMLLMLCGIFLLLLPWLLVDTVYRWCCWLIRKREAILLYETPAMTAGETCRPGDSAEAKEKFNSFLAKYFERVEPDKNHGSCMICKLNWKSTALPNAEWPKQCLKAENGDSRLITFILTEDLISFPSGIVFPIPLKEPASYNFLKQFSADAPFKMIIRNFSVFIPMGKKGRYARKPDTEISARLNAVISQASDPV